MKGKLHIIVLFAPIFKNSFAQKNDTKIERLLKKKHYPIDLSSSQKAMHTFEMLLTETNLNDQELNSEIDAIVTNTRSVEFQLHKNYYGMSPLPDSDITIQDQESHIIAKTKWVKENQKNTQEVNYLSIPIKKPL